MRYADRARLEEERDEYKALAEYYMAKCKSNRLKTREKLQDAVFLAVLGVLGIAGVYMLMSVIESTIEYLK